MSTTCDVMVIGAGVAGAAAAVAAARGGARTILVEKETYLGGTGYAGMFPSMCGLYLNSSEPPTETLNPGISREIVARLREIAASAGIVKMGQVYVQPFGREDLQSILTALCYAEKDIAMLRGNTLAEVAVEDGMIISATVNGARGNQTIEPKMLIDCSGSGEAAALAGAAFDLSPIAERQLAGFVVKVSGLTGVDGLELKVPFHLAKAAAQGLVMPSAKFTTFSPGTSPGEGFCKISIDTDEAGPDENKVRLDAEAVIKHLATVEPAFKEARIVETSPKVLEREGRRVIGQYTLSEEDVLSARKFPDGVVRNAWPIELWNREKGTRYRYLPQGEYYEIPFRCQMVQGFPNLLTAGRCISVSHEALGSTRVMGTCIALGEQAGKAAAFRIQNGHYPENIKEY